MGDVLLLIFPLIHIYLLFHQSIRCNLQITLAEIPPSLSSSQISSASSTTSLQALWASGLRLWCTVFYRPINSCRSLGDTLIKIRPFLGGNWYWGFLLSPCRPSDPHSRTINHKIMLNVHGRPTNRQSSPDDFCLWSLCDWCWNLSDQEETLFHVGDLKPLFFGWWVRGLFAFSFTADHFQNHSSNYKFYFLSVSGCLVKFSTLLLFRPISYQ